MVVRFNASQKQKRGHFEHVRDRWIVIAPWSGWKFCSKFGFTPTTNGFTCLNNWLITWETISLCDKHTKTLSTYSNHEGRFYYILILDSDSQAIHLSVCEYRFPPKFLKIFLSLFPCNLNSFFLFSRENEW